MKKKNKNHLSIKKQKRIEHVLRCRSTFNRIVKDDIRRRFPVMFVNILNQGNSELTHALLSRYCTPDCDVFADPMPQYGLSYLHLKGPSQYAHYVELGNSPLPDYMYTIIGVRVIRRYHEDVSIVEIYSDFKGTRLVCSSYSPPSQDQETLDVVSVSGPFEMTKVEFSVKMKASFYMNHEGAIVKVIGCNIESLPASVRAAILSAH